MATSTGITTALLNARNENDPLDIEQGYGGQLAPEAGHVTAQDTAVVRTEADLTSRDKATNPLGRNRGNAKLSPHRTANHGGRAMSSRAK